VRLSDIRTGLFIYLDETDRQRLDALIGDRNTSQKHVWRARIVLRSADRVETNAIMVATVRKLRRSAACISFAFVARAG